MAGSVWMAGAGPDNPGAMIARHCTHALSRGSCVSLSAAAFHLFEWHGVRTRHAADALEPHAVVIHMHDAVTRVDVGGGLEQRGQREVRDAALVAVLMPLVYMACSTYTRRLTGACCTSRSSMPQLDCTLQAW